MLAPVIRRILLAVSLSGVAFLAVPAGASADSQSGELGKVKATLSYSLTKKDYYDRYKHLRLQITNAGKVVYDQPVRQPGCTPYCSPGYAGPHTPSVRVLELEEGSPDVVLELYSGGAHCCSFIQVFSPKGASGKYTKAWHDFGNPGAAIEKESGQWVFISTDNNFYYKFTDYADSGAPIQIYRFFHGTFAQVTRNYVSLIKRDASQYWKAFTHNYRNGEGVIAAWAADEDLLGNFQLVQTRLKQELKAHHLNSVGYPWPGGRKFIAALNHFLVKLGYQAGPG